MIKVYPRFGRSAFLRRRSVLPLEMVHKVRIEPPNVDLLLRFFDLGRIWQPDCCRYPLRTGWQAWSRCLAMALVGLHVRKSRNEADQNCSIIEGSITCFVGLCVMLILPDFPHTWKRLSPEEKHVANRRMAIDAAEADVDEAGGMVS